MELVLNHGDLEEKFRNKHAYSVTISDFRATVRVVIENVLFAGGKVFYATPSAGRVSIIKGK